MFRALAVAVAFSVVCAAFAQQPAASEAIEVQLTNLDVVVTDGQGKPVNGLTANDFEVLENGARREITNLSEVRRGSTTEGTLTVVPRRILVAVDNLTIPMGARKKTIAALRKTIDQLLNSPGDRIMVVTIAGTSHPRTPWTSDRAVIDAALDAMEKEPAAIHIDETEVNNMFAELIRAASGELPKASLMETSRSQQTDPRSGAPSPSSSEEEKLADSIDYGLILTRARAFAGSRQNEARQTLKALSSTLNQFSAVPGGRRLVVLVGGALPLFPGSDIFQRLDSALKDIERTQRNKARSMKSANANLDSPLLEKTSFDVTRDVDALATSARLKGIPFYAVNPDVNDKQSNDIGSRVAGGAGSNFSALNASVDGFYRLAFATGGESHVGRGAEVALSDIRTDLDSYYSLGYRSQSPITPETKIVVKTKGGLTARASIAAAAVSPEWQVADQVLSQHFSDPGSNDLGINLVAEPGVPAADGTRKMTVRVMIPFDRLQVAKEGADYVCAFSVFVSVGDATGGAQPQQETRNFKWNAETVNKLRGKSIAYGVNLTVGPGRDRVSVGMLDLRSGKTGYAKTVLQ
ncbi:MAG TPA: VWA domain-containing protein [Thermoanaerobaculia bacterium]|nr:VWA domain-containing protein [Thermoanaerobaculia bacterium]